MRRRYEADRVFRIIEENMKLRAHQFTLRASAKPGRPGCGGRRTIRPQMLIKGNAPSQVRKINMGKTACYPLKNCSFETTTFSSLQKTMQIFQRIAIAFTVDDYYAQRSV